MNWIDSHSGVEEGCHSWELQDQPFTFCRRFGTASIISTESSACTLSFFFAACDRAGMKISTKNIEILCLSTNPRQCMRQVNGNTLQQMDKFKYLWLVFTSDGRRSAMRLIGELAELTLFCVSFIALAATKQELSNTAKLSVFNSIFVPILTYGHESWLMTERILTQVQAPKMGFLRRVHGVTKGRTEVRLRRGKNKFGASIFEPMVFWE